MWREDRSKYVYAGRQFARVLVFVLEIEEALFETANMYNFKVSDDRTVKRCKPEKLAESSRALDILGKRRFSREMDRPVWDGFAEDPFPTYSRHALRCIENPPWLQPTLAPRDCS